MKRAGITLALLLSVAALYAMTLSAPIIYDDVSHVSVNPALDKPAKVFWPSVAGRNYFYFAGERSYQPLVTIIHRYTYIRIPLLRALGIALHGLNAVLWLFFCLRLTGSLRQAAFAAFLFAFFPMNTEAVNISAFKGHLLVFTFAVSSLLCWERALRASKTSCAWVGAAALLFAGSLLAKESGMTTLGFLALYGALFAPREKAARLSWPFWLIGAAYLVFRFAYLVPPPPFPVSFSASPLRSFGWYAKTLVDPYPLCLEHDPGQPWPLALGGAAFAAALFFARKKNTVFFGLAWTACALLPVLHFIAFANVSPVADRYLYGASAGFALALAALFSEPPAVFGLYALLALWGGSTAARNGLYRKPRELFEQTAACAPENPRSHYLLGLYYMNEEEDPERATAAFEKVVALKDGPGSRTILGDILRARGLNDAAAENYRKAQAMEPDWEKAHAEAARFLRERAPGKNPARAKKPKRS